MTTERQPIKRLIALSTDDEDEAFSTLMLKRAEPGGAKWDMAEVRTMVDPPKTIHKWVVFRNIEDSHG